MSFGEWKGREIRWFLFAHVLRILAFVSLCFCFTLEREVALASRLGVLYASPLGSVLLFYLFLLEYLLAVEGMISLFFVVIRVCMCIEDSNVCNFCFVFRIRELKYILHTTVFGSIKQGRLKKD